MKSPWDLAGVSGWLKKTDSRIVAAWNQYNAKLPSGKLRWCTGLCKNAQRQAGVAAKTPYRVARKPVLLATV
jgi:hypothetical protein